MAGDKPAGTFRLVLLYNSRWVFTTLGTVLTIFMIYGPLPLDRADHNAIRYLLGPIVFPAITLLCTLAFPVRPYRGSSARREGLEDLDQRDPDAKRLADTFVSPQARAFQARTALKLSAVTLAVMIPVSFVFRHQLSWSLNSPWLFFGTIGSLIGCFIAIKSELVTWAVRECMRDGDADR